MGTFSHVSPSADPEPAGWSPQLLFSHQCVLQASNLPEPEPTYPGPLGQPVTSDLVAPAQETSMAPGAPGIMQQFAL